MGYKILKTVKLGKKKLGNIVQLGGGEEAFVSVRANRDHIYMGGHPINFLDAEREGKLEWAVNEAEIIKMRDDGVKYVIIESTYYGKLFMVKLAKFLDSTVASRFRHYDKKTGDPLDYQRSLNFCHFGTKKKLITKL